MNEPIKVLLVEDNRGDAELIEEMIRDTQVSYSLTWINNGQTAIDFFIAENEMDIILLDLKIPRVSGHEILSFLDERGIPSKIPVIIMTGSTYQADIEQTKVKGVARYLLKPMSIEEMNEITKTLKEIFLNRLRGT